ncbi:MAG: DUF6167 family protein [Propioniciclava sp.]|uniref:DUF6167 family protein n=1 Tax=Propioniciclava sp. TaxID=2038686 RepID=UPI0039E6393A
MSRTLWFIAGAAASAFVVVKGRQYYRRLTPAGVADEIEHRVEETTQKTSEWLADFAETFSNARAAKKSELTALLTREERGQLE